LTACGSNFASAHQVANVLLQKLIVVVKLIVLFANGFNAVEDGKERILECFRMSVKVSVGTISIK
jgi:hypothetical protein